MAAVPNRTLDNNFDFAFNAKMNRSLVFDLATCGFIGKREDALFLGPGGTGKSHLAQAIGQAAIQQGSRRCRRSECDARPPPASRSRARVRPAELAHEVGGRCSVTTARAGARWPFGEEYDRDTSLSAV